ncbi:MAG: dTDP-4-dehydrorhamnose 3,5-epimerase [Bacteroidota bacterium]
MKVIATQIPEVLIFEPEVFGDHRGYFFESFRQDVFEKYVGKIQFVQDNQSKSGFGVLRGLHFQRPPFTQAKLVQCLQGEVLDIAVDIRIGSPTYGKHVPVQLSETNHRQLFIPRGFAHGFAVLSETAVFSYKCDNYYNSIAEGGLSWNDPQVNINWILESFNIKLSEKDKSQPSLMKITHFDYKNFR